ncbi:M28 family metallopeptidase [Sphingomonas sp.]|uniref:M28 family metallopeptidase n=1 Tax=Sphingomonas sp. TaxID=28214 RepID=UPI002DD67C7E|nr:M28 family metallopeptidase [Sphingomonas sp.]
MRILRLAAVSPLALLAAAALHAQEAPAPAPAPQPVSATELAKRNATVNAALPPAEAAMKAHVMFLASDALKGREAGTPEYDIAAQYVASQFYAAGLRPAGDAGSYLQAVPLIQVKAKDKGSLSYTPPRGKPVPLVFGQDYAPGTNASQATTNVTGGLAFVGYGIVNPETGRDDYAGVDVKGKIVLVFGGAPKSFHPEIRAHYGSLQSKRQVAQMKGAAGVILIENAAGAKAGNFARLAEGYNRSRTAWAKDGVGFDPAPRAPALGSISQAYAAKLFGTGWAAIAKGAESDETRFKAQALPGTLSATINTEWTTVASSNVAGIIPGGDPKVKDEVVVLTAHLDHVGVGRAVNGDTIYNGAEDNAVGIASLIEEAKKFKASGTPPRRSILFLAVTAEEKGLVGAEYFANNPSFGADVPGGRMVANVNLDMPIITYKFEDVIAFGAERSTLGPIVKRAAAGIGVGFSPDPMPDQSLFVRSDHYRFVQQGVPSVFLWPGVKGPGQAAVDEFFAKHYHKPSDEPWNPAIDWSQGVRFIEVNYAIAREIADAAERPAWNKGDFFGTFYNGHGAK